MYILVVSYFAVQAASKVLSADEKKQIEQAKKVRKNELMVSTKN